MDAQRYKEVVSVSIKDNTHFYDLRLSADRVEELGLVVGLEYNTGPYGEPVFIGSRIDRTEKYET